MSLPSFPERDNLPSREEVINQIISSIAMEELGLSHIINAEGEKLQFALGTIPGQSGPEGPITIEDLLDLNESVHKTLDSTMMNQFFLKEKLITALSASIMQGPTGPTGPQGPATIDVDSTVVPLGPNDTPTVENTGTPENVILQFGIPRGATGATGAVGPTGPTEIYGLQAESRNNLDATIADGTPIIFDTIISRAGAAITYDDVTGRFTLGAAGHYLINWWASIDGTDGGAGSRITVDVNGVPFSNGVTSVPESHISGSALITVANITDYVTITNRSGYSISLDDENPQAGITIMTIPV